MPTSTLRDLITRYAKWQEAGGVRQSIMISNRRGSSLSNEENDTEIDSEGDVIAWDFDTSFSDVAPSSLVNETKPLAFPSLDYSTESLSDTLLTRPLRSPSLGQSTLVSSSGTISSLPMSIQHNSATEHPLEQLFNDGTVRSAAAPPPLRSRKDTLPSRPVSPLPPLTGLSTQPSSPDSESRPGTALSTASFDLWLPDIAPTAPIQIEIPATQDTLRKDPPGVRSRSATVTRTARSDSAGSAGYPGRLPRHNATEPMPQPHSPPRSSRAVSPKPTLNPLANPITAAYPHKAQAPPLSPPKSVLGMPPIPPTSPTKSQHIPSKSAPINSPLPGPPLSSTAPIQDHMLIKARSADLKTSRAPNLTLNVEPSRKSSLNFSYHRRN
jgi:hypothetical protein